MTQATSYVAANITQIVIALIENLPAILTALAATAGAVFAVLNGWKTDKVIDKTDKVSAQTERIDAGVIKAAENAETAALKADVAVATTDAISLKSDKIAENTNGHLTRLSKEVDHLLARNEGLEKTVTTLVNILTAERVTQANAANKPTVTVPSVRQDDLTQAVQTIAEIQQAHDEAPTPDQRAKDE